MFMRKYGTAATVNGVPLITRGAVDFKSNPTLSTGDVKISKDDGAFANLATLPTVTPASGTSVKIVLSDAELQCKSATIIFVDQTSPKEWEDQEIIIETFGNASAMHAVDFSDAVAFGLSRLDDTVTSRMATFTPLTAQQVWEYATRTLSAAGVQAIWEYTTRTLSSFGTLIADIWANAVRTITDKTGFTITNTIPTASDIKTALEATGSKIDVTNIKVASLNNTDLTAIVSAIEAIPTNPLLTDDDRLDHIDVDISSRLAATDYTPGGGGSVSGSGAIAYDYYIYQDEAKTIPLADCRIWVATFDDPETMIAGPLYSDAFGKTSWNLDAGSHYFHGKKSGWNQTTPDLEVVA